MPINIYGMPSGYDQPSGPRGRGIRNPQEPLDIMGPGGATTPTAWGGSTPQQPPAQEAPPPVAKPRPPAQPAQPAQSLAQRYPSIVEAYKKFLGREPSEQEIAGQTGGGSWGSNDPRIQSSIGNIQWSQEAQAYQQRPVTPQTTAPSTNPSTPNTPPPATAPRGANPGLDAGKWESGYQSPKYAFYEVAQKYDQRTPEGRAQTLAELRQRFPQWYSGWTIAGDKLRFTGDPNSLDGKWDGFTEFDAWRGSDAGEWAPQWMATGRNGQAWTDPAAVQQQAMQQALTTATQTYAPGQPPSVMPTIPRPSNQVVKPFVPDPDPYGGRGSAEWAEDQMRAAQTGRGFQYGLGQDDDLRTYEPINALPDYNAPDFGAQEQAQIDALMSVLQNPGIPPQQMEQMKRRQMEALMATKGDTLNQTKYNYLRRGLRGGALGAAERRAEENFGADLTRSNRDIDIANAGMRTQDILNASSGLTSAMGGAFDRANSGFSTALNRVLAGEGLRGASADSYRAVYNDDAGIGFNNLNLAEQIRQYDLSSQLAMKQFLESQRQFNSGMGFNYSQLSQQQNEAMLRALGLL